MTKPIERDTIYRCRRFSAGITYFEPWTRTENPLDLCSAMIAIKNPHRHFSEQPSRMGESHGLRKSTSMAIKQPFEVWSRLARKIPAVGKWKCARREAPLVEGDVGMRAESGEQVGFARCHHPTQFSRNCGPSRSPPPALSRVGGNLASGRV